ncbi:MAG TPA: hypothetical protein VMY99_02785 [Nevskiaceae bacterium]|nr:hypothetical protein [Nevskiaceae bacterium]
MYEATLPASSEVDALFADIMFANDLGGLAMADTVQSPADTRAQITEAEINAFAAALNNQDGATLSASDQEFLAANQMTPRELTAKEQKIVDANEAAALAALNRMTHDRLIRTAAMEEEKDDSSDV